MTIWYIDPRISNAQESDSYAGGEGVGKLRNSWADVTFAAGDTYLQFVGTTFSGRILVNVTGAAAARVTIGVCDEAGNRIPDGSRKALLNGAGTAQTIRTSGGVNYVTIDGYEVYGTDGTGSARGIGIYLGNGDSALSSDWSSNCIIRNCLVRDISNAVKPGQDNNGIQAFGNDNVVENNVVQDIPVDGIWMQGSRLIVRNNTVRRISNTGANSGDCVQINGTANLRSNGCQIIDNYLDHSNYNTKQVIIYGSPGFADGGLIMGNVCLMADDDGVIETTCIFVESAGCRVIGNDCRGGYRGYYGAANNIRLTGNVFRLHKIGAAEGNVTGLLAHVNTIADCELYGLLADDGNTTLDARGNVLLRNGVGLAKHGSGTENYNCYFGNGTDQENLAGGASWGANNVTSDPLLDSSYRPREGSPLIGAGTYIAGARHMGGKRMSVINPTIGAYNYEAPRSVALTRAIAGP